MSVFTAAIESGWKKVAGPDAPLAWIVSSDYGLVCQLHWHLADEGVNVAVPGDGIFSRTWTTFLRADPPGPVLILSGEDARCFAGTVRTLPLVPIATPHPVTGGPVMPLAAYRHSSSE